jgi:uncharacterized protein
MPRPRRRRMVSFEPGVTYFKPRGIPLKELEEVTLSFEELEAMRLINVEKIKQEEAAEKMGVSQPTFYRMLKEGREKLTKALVEGKAIRIEKVIK